MSGTETQNLEILRALLRGSHLTPLDARKFFDCDRLPARIYDLKNDHGVDIESKMVKVASGKRVKEYWLSEAEMKRLVGKGAKDYLSRKHHTLPKGAFA